jgi:mersacidin/lichenicidin family type 2 lantibiotic
MYLTPAFCPFLEKVNARRNGMSIDEIIRAWKAEDDEEKNGDAPINPAGEELSDEELEQVEGGNEAPDDAGMSQNVCTCAKISCL